MLLRFTAILAMLAAGLLRAPFSPLTASALADVPAHELFYAVLSAVQVMWAVYYLVFPTERAAWGGVLIAGSSLTLMLFARVVDVPFTNASLPNDPAFAAPLIAEAVALLSLLFRFGVAHAAAPPPDHARIWRTSALVGAGCLITGAGVWGAARIAEPYLPGLAHNIVDQFAVFDQAALLDASGYAWDLPAGFPVPFVPPDNPMTEAKVELGRYLFYDTRLSGNNTMSCASCHHQERAFTDGLALPVGSTGESHVRNAQTLTNVAYNATFTWGSPVLTEIEQQVVIPLFGEFPVEMGITGSEDVVLARLSEAELYRVLFATAYPDEAEPITFHHVVEALSSFTRTLISGSSPYDRFVYGGDYAALSESALRGLDLFLSERFECHHCHGGFNFTLSTRHAGTTFTEQPFFNTGLYNIGGTGAYPPGGMGVYEFTGDPADRGRFRPPTLRNVELTAPYMHDGSIATLEEVILFYADGGRVIEDGPYAGDGREHPNKSGFVPGFEITEQEMTDLIAFLRSLTDEAFITNPAFADPFTAPGG